MMRMMTTMLVMMMMRPIVMLMMMSTMMTIRHKITQGSVENPAGPSFFALLRGLAAEAKVRPPAPGLCGPLREGRCPVGEVAVGPQPPCTCSARSCLARSCSSFLTLTQEPMVPSP